MALVQTRTVGGISTDPITAAYSSNVTAGNVLVAGVVFNDVLQEVSDVTDSLGNIWVRVASNYAFSYGMDIWMANNIATGANTVSMDLTGTPLQARMFLWEVSGLATATPGPFNTRDESTAQDPLPCATLSATLPGVVFCLARADTTVTFTAWTDSFVDTGGGANSRAGYRIISGATSVAPTIDYTTTHSGESLTWVLYSNAAQKVTQLTLEVLIDEDADDDQPPVVDLPPGAFPCAGGGTVASGSDPSAGTSLTTATQPLTWIEVTVGATTYRWSNVSIPHGTLKQGRVQSFGAPTRRLADADHGYEASRVTSTVIDTDGVLRALSIAGTLKGAVIDYYQADLATIKAAGSARRVFRGLIDEFEAQPDRMFSLTSVDLLTARLTSIDADDLQTPVVLVGGNISDQNPLERMFDKPVPEAYGGISDEDDAEPEGVWECKHLGFITMAGYEDLGNMPVFLGFLGASKKVQAVFAADPHSGDPPITRTKVGASAYGDWRTDDNAWLLVPGMTGWPFGGDYNDMGDGLRYTLIFGRDGHPSIMQAVQNRIPLVINACTRESSGDATGTMISSGPRALLHWLNNAVLQQATTTWLSQASFGDYSVCATATFEAVHDICDALGYVVAGVIGADFTQASWRDRVAEFCRSFGFEFGQNRHGQAMIDKLDVTATASGAPAFTPDQILEHSVTVDHRLDAIENSVRYAYAKNYKTALPDLTPAEGSRLYRDPFDGEWGSGLQTTEDSGSISDLGGSPKGIRRSALQEYTMVRDATTADAVADERLALRSSAKGRAEITFDLFQKHGCDLELGDLITVEHWDLPWTGSRRCRVLGLTWDLDAYTIQVVAQDVDDLLA